MRAISGAELNEALGEGPVVPADSVWDGQEGAAAAAIRRSGHRERGCDPDEAWYADDMRMAYVRCRLPLDLLATEYDGVDGRDEPWGARLARIQEYSQRATEPPPVVVTSISGNHRYGSFRYSVQDGNHRVEAARLRGASDIAVLLMIRSADGRIMAHDVVEQRIVSNCGSVGNR